MLGGTRPDNAIDNDDWMVNKLVDADGAGRRQHIRLMMDRNAFAGQMSEVDRTRTDYGHTDLSNNGSLLHAVGEGWRRKAAVVVGMLLHRTSISLRTGKRARIVRWRRPGLPPILDALSEFNIFSLVEAQQAVAAAKEPSEQHRLVLLRCCCCGGDKMVERRTWVRRPLQSVLDYVFLNDPGSSVVHILVIRKLLEIRH